MRLRTAQRSRILSLLLVLALVVAACGDGRDDGDDTSAEGDDDTDQPADDGNGGDDGGDDGEAAFTIDTEFCATDPASVGIEGDTITFGTSLPQSGLYAAFAEILRGEQAYFSYVNEELGGVEINGNQYRIELLAKDDAYQADQTVTNVDQLVQDDGVFALFNVVGTRNNLAIRDFVNEECVPNLFAATGSPAWGNRDYPWILGTGLVPYSIEMQAFVDYLTETKPDATIAVLRANDDFGRAYSDTLRALTEGTDMTIVQEETYDPEGADVAAQVTSLAATNADAWVLGATLLGCPTALREADAAGWSPIIYMSGTCTSKTLMNAAAEAGDGVISVSPAIDPNDPQYASDEDLVLYNEKIAQYSPEADPTNGIVVYGWVAAAALVETLQRIEGEPTRLSLMQAARTLEVSDLPMMVPGATWSVSEDDWFLGEQFNLVQFSFADGFFKPLGELRSYDDQTEEITPDDLING